MFVTTIGEDMNSLSISSHGKKCSFNVSLIGGDMAYLSISP